MVVSVVTSAANGAQELLVSVPPATFPSTFDLLNLVFTALEIFGCFPAPCHRWILPHERKSDYSTPLTGPLRRTPHAMIDAFERTSLVSQQQYNAMIERVPEALWKWKTPLRIHADLRFEFPASLDSPATLGGLFGCGTLGWCFRAPSSIILDLEKAAVTTFRPTEAYLILEARAPLPLYRQFVHATQQSHIVKRSKTSVLPYATRILPPYPVLCPYLQFDPGLCPSSIEFEILRDARRFVEPLSVVAPLGEVFPATGFILSFIGAFSRPPLVVLQHPIPYSQSSISFFLATGRVISSTMLPVRVPATLLRQYVWESPTWSLCQPLSGTCGRGSQYHAALCVSSATGLQVPSSFCRNEDLLWQIQRPFVNRDCFIPCSANGGVVYLLGPWSSCSKECDGGLQQRPVTCAYGNGTSVACPPGAPPAEVVTSLPCNNFPCEVFLTVSAWSDCSQPCGSGFQQRTLSCVGADGNPVAFSRCQQGAMPRGRLFQEVFGAGDSDPQPIAPATIALEKPCNVAACRSREFSTVGIRRVQLAGDEEDPYSVIPAVPVVFAWSTFSKCMPAAAAQPMIAPSSSSIWHMPPPAFKSVLPPASGFDAQYRVRTPVCVASPVNITGTVWANHIELLAEAVARVPGLQVRRSDTSVLVIREATSFPVFTKSVGSFTVRVPTISGDMNFTRVARDLYTDLMVAAGRAPYSSGSWNGWPGSQLATTPFVAPGFPYNPCLDVPRVNAPKLGQPVVDPCFLYGGVSWLLFNFTRVYNLSHPIWDTIVVHPDWVGMLSAPSTNTYRSFLASKLTAVHAADKASATWQPYEWSLSAHEARVNGSTYFRWVPLTLPPSLCLNRDLNGEVLLSSFFSTFRKFLVSFLKLNATDPAMLPNSYSLSSLLNLYINRAVLYNRIQSDFMMPFLDIPSLKGSNFIDKYSEDWRRFRMARIYSGSHSSISSLSTADVVSDFNSILLTRIIPSPFVAVYTSKAWTPVPSLALQFTYTFLHTRAGFEEILIGLSTEVTEDGLSLLDFVNGNSLTGEPYPFSLPTWDTCPITASNDIVVQFLPWQPCGAECGLGSQQREFTCATRDGVSVAASTCETLVPLLGLLSERQCAGKSDCSCSSRRDCLLKAGTVGAQVDCDRSKNGGTCVCKPGWQGPTCTERRTNRLLEAPVEAPRALQATQCPGVTVELPTGQCCAGVVNLFGQCCGTILPKSQAGDPTIGAEALVEYAFDQEGNCCKKTDMDGCGLCHGTGVALGK